jgi:NADPH:quinone reductase-like Zn-dependent oxidoreductase
VVEILGQRVCVGLIHWRQADLVARCQATPGRVLVRKRGFSCGYRDLGRALEVTRFAPRGACSVIGSEFVGEVVAMAPDVTALEIGDRVIGDYHFPDRSAPHGGGVPSSHASMELALFPEDTLMKIPAAMADEVAAGFTIGAQTSYSIVRRLGLDAGQRALLTAGGSNTSLFVLAALRRQGVEVFVTTRGGARRVARLKELGAAGVFEVEPGRAPFFDHPGIRSAAGADGFDAVVDPFFDLHLGRAVTVLAFGGRYVTCGLLDQVPLVTGPRVDRRPEDLEAVMHAAIAKNLALIGNCLGTTEDLRRAVDDHCAGHLPVVIDSVFRGREVGPWLRRTFCDPERLGRTPFLFE